MKKHERVPFEVIVSATEGDPEAIATVMNFYDGYISKLCLRKLYETRNWVYGSGRRFEKQSADSFSGYDT